MAHILPNQRLANAEAMLAQSALRMIERHSARRIMPDDLYQSARDAADAAREAAIMNDLQTARAARETVVAARQLLGSWLKG